MPVTVRTFASSGEAAAALSSDRGARYLGGGTLVMRALNEGDISISTVVRANDPALTRIDATGSRVTIGAGVTFARILAERDLAFLHAPARSIGGPAVRNMGTVGGNLFAPNPYGDFTVACSRSTRWFPCKAASAAATCRSRNSCSRASGRPAPSCFRSRARSPPAPRRSATARSPASSRRAARSSRLPRICPMSSGRIVGARIALGSMAPTQIRARAAERALEGRSLDASTIDAAAAAAVEGTSPGDNALASGWYRREIVGVHLRRLLSGQE